MNSISAKGVAIITGAARGIGRSIASRLASDGFEVALNDLESGRELLESLAAEIADPERNVLIVTGDVSLEDDVKSMFEKVVQMFGGVDVMVANAGICVPKPFLQTTVEDWDHMFAINVRGIFLCYQYAVQQMVVQGRGGRIIGASSAAGQQGEAMVTTYSSTKFAIRGLTQSVAAEFGPHGITVNAYAPGAIDTPAMRSIGENSGNLNGFYESEKKKTVVGRNGTTDEIASLVSYLVSKEAGFITGQTISVNGGRHFD